MNTREIEMLLAYAGTHWDDRTGAVLMPVYQTSTFRHPALRQSTGFDYSRSGNPNRQVLEELMANVEGGARGLAFSSGMAAIDCLMLLFKPGDELIVSEDPLRGDVPFIRKGLSPAWHQSRLCRYIAKRCCCRSHNRTYPRLIHRKPDKSAAAHCRHSFAV